MIEKMGRQCDRSNFTNFFFMLVVKQANGLLGAIFAETVVGFVGFQQKS